MDLLLKFIIKGQYSNIVEFIKVNTLELPFVNIFLCVIFCAIHRIITDKQLFTLILLFTNCGVTLDHIGSPYYIIYLFGKLSDEYYMSKTHILKLQSYKVKDRQIDSMYKVFKSLPCNNDDCGNNFGTTKSLILLNCITNFISYMGSHRISQYSNPMYPPISEEYSYIQEEEILNRLRSLTNIIPLKVLKSFGIELLSFDDFMCLDHMDKYYYYISCIDNINVHMKELLIVIDRYASLDKEIKYYNNMINKLL